MYFVCEASFDTFSFLTAAVLSCRIQMKTLIFRLSWGDWKKMCWVCGNKKSPVLK